MSYLQTQGITGNRIPSNGMYVGTNNGNGKENSWKLVFGDEARKINPLHDVNVGRNNMITSAIQNDDWSAYNEFEAKQHPAWYEKVDGTYQPNKVYYGNLIESKIRALKEAQAENDQEKIEIWSKSLEEAIEDFNNAPGIVPYVVGLNHNESVAAANGVPEPGDDYFDSKWNSNIVASQGKFEQNMWYDNAIFAEDKELKQHVETLVAGTFPTSKEFNDQVQVANEVKTPKAVEVAENVEPEQVTLAEQEETKATSDDISLQSIFLHNLKFAFKPNLNVVEELYK